MLRCAFLATSLALSGFAVHAQTRSFPATALRGELTVSAPPVVLLNRKPARLAPGARIRAADNMLLLSGQILNQRLLVHYTLDLQGNVLDVWVLTPQEAERKPWPATAQEAATWRFDFAQQSWSKP
jgi:hypothetical protein